MNTQEFFEIAGFFANPIRKTRIEIEASQNTINNYSTKYQTLTGVPFPINTDAVYILTNGSNKWGREMRIYFICTNEGSVPKIVRHNMTVCGRPGYELWNKRLNSKGIIDKLFDIGFRLGDSQDVSRIKGFIPAPYLNNFNQGFNAQ